MIQLRPLGLAALLALGACSHIPSSNEPDTKQCIQWEHEYDEGGRFLYRRCTEWRKDERCTTGSVDEYVHDSRVKETGDGVMVKSTKIYDTEYRRKCGTQ